MVNPGRAHQRRLDARSKVERNRRAAGWWPVVTAMAVECLGRVRRLTRRS
jgi:hypothetical protein